MNAISAKANPIHLPTLPHALIKLVEACNDEATTPQEAAEIIATDPSLAGTIMRLGNSAYFGMCGRLTTVEKAVLYLGLDLVRNLALSTSVFEVFREIEPSPHFSLERFWWHSFFVATLAKRIAGRTNPGLQEEAFLAGLLHDIGKLILWQQMGGEYAQLLKKVAHGPDLAVEEKKSFGLDHAELGSRVIEQWSLKSFLADAVRYHHEDTGRLQGAFDLLKITHAANLLSRPEGAENDTLEEILGLPFSEAEDLLAEARTDALEMASSFGINVEDETPEDGQTRGFEEKRKALVNEVRDHSLLVGTLNSLLEAETLDDVLKTTYQGMQILFNLHQTIIFHIDRESRLLTAMAPAGHKLHSRAHQLRIPLSHRRNLLVKCLAKNAMTDSFRMEDGESITIADEQIIRLLGEEGMVCLPLKHKGQCVGAIAVGVTALEFEDLAAQARLVRVFTNQAGLCLYLQELKQAQTRRIIQEREEVSAAMARVVIHEINNPLGIIRNYIGILSNRLGPEDAAHEELTIIREEIDRVKQIVKQLVSFTDKKDTRLKAVDVNKLIQDIFKILSKSMLMPAGINGRISLEPDLPHARIDPNKLVQALINLLKNATEAMSEGGNVMIRTKVDEARNRVSVLIQDDGPGIPKQVRRRLFEPSNSTKGNNHFGLGLSIVKRLISEMEGTVECRTAEDKGTSFTIYLPIYTPTEPIGES